VVRAGVAAALPALAGIALGHSAVAAAVAAITAAHTDPAWTRTLWPEHHHLHELGYRTLARHLGPSM
jgi:hypothetical protein